MMYQIVTRKLTSDDEPQFIRLLNDVYGDTYSYRLLYEPGGFSSLLSDKVLISYGEFDSNNRLLAHTGFWRKEHHGDYLESGCSFRTGEGSSEFKERLLPSAWQECLKDLAREYSFIHAQCTTLHSLAQRYACRFMHAKPCGLILGYAQDEKIKGINQSGNLMHALMMTTVLQETKVIKEMYIPKAFQPWAQELYQRLNLPRKIITNEPLYSPKLKFQLDSLETNPYVNLQRRIIRIDERTALNFNVTPNAMRTDLIHLPTDNAILIHQLFPKLLKSGYILCGIRPHAHQPDELIFQNIMSYREFLPNIMNEIKIADKTTKQWIELWQKLILQIL